MAESEDETDQPPDTLSEVGDGERPLRRRVADTWHRLAPHAGEAAFILLSAAALTAAKGYIARSTAQTPAVVEQEETAAPTFEWRGNGEGGYYSCSHQGCQKKADPIIVGHQCCGRCWPGRDCHSAAQRNYDGPGHFPHSYDEAFRRPGVCAHCGEPSEAHLWVYDRHIGERRAR